MECSKNVFISINDCNEYNKSKIDFTDISCMQFSIDYDNKEEIVTDTDMNFNSYIIKIFSKFHDVKNNFVFSPIFNVYCKNKLDKVTQYKELHEKFPYNNCYTVQEKKQIIVNDLICYYTYLKINLHNLQEIPHCGMYLIFNESMPDLIDYSEVFEDDDYENIQHRLMKQVIKTNGVVIIPKLGYYNGSSIYCSYNNKYSDSLLELYNQIDFRY